MTVMAKPMKGLPGGKRKIVHFFLIILFSSLGIAHAEPKNLGEELFNMTEISVKVKVQSGKVSMEGQAPLAGNDINYDK